MIINLFEFGNFFSTRKEGEKIRKILFDNILRDREIEVNFSEVAIITQSFADECFGKLAVKIGMNEFYNNIEFSNINDDIFSIINHVVKKRVSKK